MTHIMLLWLCTWLRHALGDGSHTRRSMRRGVLYVQAFLSFLMDMGERRAHKLSAAQWVCDQGVLEALTTICTVGEVPKSILMAARPAGGLLDEEEEAGDGEEEEEEVEEEMDTSAA